MNLTQLRNRWNQLARRDAMWAVLTETGKENERWVPEQFFSTGASDVRRVLQRLAEHKVSLNPVRALDFGCGIGRLTSALSRVFQRVDGVDISDEMIARARQARDWPESTRFIHSPDPKLGILDSKAYDFVLSLIAIQHIPERLALKYIGSLCRVLAPGGTAYLQMGTFLNPSIPEALAKLSRDESFFNRLYRDMRDRVKPKTDLMSTFYCRVSRAVEVLEKNRMRLITIVPEDTMGGHFVSHVVIFQKPNLLREPGPSLAQL